MTSKLQKVLSNQEGNYILPFFWQHGETEEVLRKYMQVIDESNIKAVCVESRPHPDFCGPQWWNDLDIIIDEAKNRNMKVWILDDSHFPTGYANGALNDKPDELRRQFICSKSFDCLGGTIFHLEEQELLNQDDYKPSFIEEMINKMQGGVEYKQFDDTQLFCVTAIRLDSEEIINITDLVSNNELTWTVPEGEWKVNILHLTRNRGPHREYINMIDTDSCSVLIDEVYEKHWERYQAYFGNVLVGFFSDEPELGNGNLYGQGNVLGVAEDLPWSVELAERLKVRLGEEFDYVLALLFGDVGSSQKKAYVRYAYMDELTKLVRETFSMQIGNWCRAHGVEYIGHVIEDNNQHARTGSSLGHYFRGLAGQDMAGIDGIGGQVYPGGEEVTMDPLMGRERDGEFYHYMLGKLGSSHAAIDPLKKGRAMCELFGNYGWEEGVRLEKYLVDHFLVRGINHFVPHAFSPKDFPDSDCPPHFYAHGHNPQYRHFGKLMKYTNRVSELLNDGHHIAPVAVIYHGEVEWTGDCMLSQKVGRILADGQIEFDYIPQDVFTEKEVHNTIITDSILKINQQEYSLVIVPTMEYITKSFMEYLILLQQNNVKVIFVDKYPEGICDVEDKLNISELENCTLVSLNELESAVRESITVELVITPSNNRIRYRHYVHKDGTSVYFIINEGDEVYNGQLQLEEQQNGYVYDAWENTIIPFNEEEMKVQIAPLKSLILIFGELNGEIEIKKSIVQNTKVNFNGEWNRSICKSIDYPNFIESKKVSLPDNLEVENPAFSGFVRYENTFEVDNISTYLLEITDAHEGVEVFVNGESVGIQIAPPFVYHLEEKLVIGENTIGIEVATTLEREMSVIPDFMGQIKEAKSLSGITGQVTLYNCK